MISLHEWGAHSVSVSHAEEAVVTPGKKHTCVCSTLHIYISCMSNARCVCVCVCAPHALAEEGEARGAVLLEERGEDAAHGLVLVQVVLVPLVLCRIRVGCSLNL